MIRACPSPRFFKRYDSIGVNGWGSANDVIPKELVERGGFLSGRTSENGWKARRVCSVKLKDYYSISLLFVKELLVSGLFAEGWQRCRFELRPAQRKKRSLACVRLCCRIRFPKSIETDLILDTCQRPHWRWPPDALRPSQDSTEISSNIR